MKISEITSQVAQGTIRLNDVPVAARAISSDEDEFIRMLRPQPRPTKEKPTPQRGQVVMKPDTSDPAYQKAVSEWAVQYACLELAVACGLETGGGKAFDPAWLRTRDDKAAMDAANQWAKEAIAELAGGLPRRVIDDAIDELRSLEAGAVARAYAHVAGVEPDELDEHERRRCRINVGASANNIALAAQLAKRYKPDDFAAWWDAMPIGQRAVHVATELFLTREAE
jgi:hypothetical protein